MADATEYPQSTSKPKKRKSVGSKKDLAKKARVGDHVTGEDCHCSVLKCFNVINNEDRSALIETFNSFSSKDSFLSSLITTLLWQEDPDFLERKLD